MKKLRLLLPNRKPGNSSSSKALLWSYYADITGGDALVSQNLRVNLLQDRLDECDNQYP